MTDKPEILTRRVKGASGTMWRAAYRFSPLGSWRHVSGPANRILRFTSEQAAKAAAKYHAAKHGD